MEKATRFPWEFDGEAVVIETPEQTRIEYRLAPLGSRFAATMGDRLLIGLFFAVLVLIGLVGFLSLGSIGPNLLFYAWAVLVVAWFIVPFFYFVWGDVRREGQTWGKRQVGIRTVMATGHGVTLAASVVRNLARVIDEIPLFWLVPALSRGNRRIGDFLAGTLVVLAERDERGPGGPVDWPAPSYRELAERRFYFSAETAGKLYRDDLNLIEHLHERLRHAGPGRRRRAAEDVARRYIDRLGLEPDEERILEEPERFLLEMGLFLRERHEGQAY